MIICYFRGTLEISVESMLYKGYYVLLAAEVGLASHLWRKYQPTWLKGTLLERAEQSRRIAGVEESPAPTKSHRCALLRQ